MDGLWFMKVFMMLRVKLSVVYALLITVGVSLLTACSTPVVDKTAGMSPSMGPLACRPSQVALNCGGSFTEAAGARGGDAEAALPESKPPRKLTHTSAS